MLAYRMFFAANFAWQPKRMAAAIIPALERVPPLIPATLARRAAPLLTALRLKSDVAAAFLFLKANVSETTISRPREFTPFRRRRIQLVTFHNEA